MGSKMKFIFKIKKDEGKSAIEAISQMAAEQAVKSFSEVCRK
jgi:hypothetical protein